MEKKCFHTLGGSKQLMENIICKSKRSYFPCIGKFSVLSFHKLTRKQDSKLHADRFLVLPFLYFDQSCYELNTFTKTTKNK